MFLFKFIAVMALGFGIFWLCSKLRSSTFGYGWAISAILEALDPRVRLIIFYITSVVILGYAYIATFTSLYFLAFAIGGTIPVVLSIIEDVRTNF